MTSCPSHLEVGKCGLDFFCLMFVFFGLGLVKLRFLGCNCLRGFLSCFFIDGILFARQLEVYLTLNLCEVSIVE